MGQCDRRSYEFPRIGTYLFVGSWVVVDLEASSAPPVLAVTRDTFTLKKSVHDGPASFNN